MFDKKVQIIGIGYVGLPLALLLAKNNVSVVGVDTNSDMIARINNGTYQIGEKKIDELLKDPLIMRNFKVTMNPEGADIFVIAVPTPIEERRKIADLSHVKDAIEVIIPVLKKGNLIIIESTIPPLTCREIVTPIIEKYTQFKVNDDIYIAHCPERILPGDIYNEIIHNSRIIGGMNEEASKLAAEMYEVFVKGEILLTNDVTAELCKLIENAYRDVNIAFANEISQVAEGLNVDTKMLIKLANRHPRVNILQPGIGVGGHCLAVDPWFIKEIDDGNTGLIQVARRINDNRPLLMSQKIRKIILEKKIKEPRILLMGASYKPNVSDIRESPALKIYQILKDEGFDIKIIDPLNENFLYKNILDELKNVNIIILAVKHNKIVEDIEIVKKNRPEIMIIDLLQ